MDGIEKYKRYLGREVTVVVDRKKGAPHPELGFVYECNYGFLAGTRAGDGNEIDAYVLGPGVPVSEFTGTCIAVIVRRDDAEHKLVVSSGWFPRDEIVRRTAFVERYFDTEYVVLEREAFS